MAEYYYDQADRSQKKQSAGVIILDIAMLVLSAIAFVAMILTIFTSHITPPVSWVFTLLELITPLVYIVTALIALYWIIRWKWSFATVLIVPLLIGAPYISHYAKIETRKSYGEPSRRGTVRIMSYNVKGFVDDDNVVSTPEINKFIEEQRPDIICFQEYDAKRYKEENRAKLLKNYNLEFRKETMAIFSRYKILDSSKEFLRKNYMSGSGFWADLLIGSDTVRLYNLHLHSTAITASDNSYISNMEFLRDTTDNDQLKNMLKRFRSTSLSRAEQADSAAYSISQSPHRVIVCGDFNNTPNSYAFRKISHGLKDAFQEAGSGFPHTYRGFLNLLRIDYILVEEPTEVLAFEVVDSIKQSDHLPIVATIKL